jgi:hypothetical protein
MPVDDRGGDVDDFAVRHAAFRKQSAHRPMSLIPVFRSKEKATA